MVTSRIQEIEIMAIVFLAVLVCGAVFLPIFFRGPKGRDGSADHLQMALGEDSPLGRFISRDELRHLCWTAALMAGCIVAALLLLAQCYYSLWLSVLIGVGAYFLPLFHYHRKAKRRQERFEADMLDFVVLVSNTLRAGIALPVAIENASENIGGPVREEFSFAMHEHRLGTELSESLKRISRRMPSENLRLFITSVCVNMRTGGSMSGVLDGVIETIRQRMQFENKLQVLLAQNKFEALVMSLTPLLAFAVLYLFDPALMKPMLTTGTGLVTWLIILVLDLLGYFSILWLTKVEY